MAAVRLEDVQPADRAVRRVFRIQVSVENAHSDDHPADPGAEQPFRGGRSKRNVAATHSSARRRKKREPSRSLSVTSSLGVSIGIRAQAVRTPGFRQN